MKRFRKLLVGVALDADGNRVGAESREAALRARWLGERTGASVALLHATGSGASSVAAQARGALDALAESCGEAGVAAEVVVVEGRPWREMIRRVTAGESDLVLVGKRKHGARKKRGLGKNALALMRKCPCPVWMVQPGRDLALRKVLAATDLGPLGAQACALAAEIARLAGAELHVCHAWQVPIELQLEKGRRSRAEMDAQVAAIERDIARKIHAGLDEADTEVEARLHLGPSCADRAIRECVAGLDPDLLVMGTACRTGFLSLIVGNTAERLFGRVGCSLLTVRAPTGGD